MKLNPILRNTCGALCWLYTATVVSSDTLDVSDSVSELVVYTAEKIITMEPAMPEASAVAVADGRIIAVGSLKSLEPWTQSRPSRVDRRFDGKIIMPGFIDPHVHPTLPAILTQFPFIAPEHWSLPTGEFPSAKTPKAYRKLLKTQVAKHSDAKIPFITWGFHPLWHGELFREELSALFPTQAVILWHRSFHELILNDAAIELLKLDRDLLAAHPQIDWERGHFYENGAQAMIPFLPFLFAPSRFSQGMKNFLEMVHRGGVTTTLDMGVGIFGDPVGETRLIRHAAESTQAPARIILTPTIMDFLGRGKSIPEALAEIDEWRENNSHRVLFDRRFKIMMDGAIFGGLAQFGFPGYIDGHKGIWMKPLEVTAQWAQAFWDAGYQIHAHTNGDGSAAALIDLLQNLQEQTPRADHRLSLEHFAYTTEDQNKQLKALGAVVSANPYYHYILSDLYSKHWLGNDRGSQMVRLGSLERLGVPFTLHSDSPMAPLEPLTLVSAAVNRVTINGNLAGQDERVSLDAALRGITSEAAWIMGWEDEIGSIRAGKRADFTILHANPYETDVKKIADIPIWGTVFEGTPAPLSSKK